MKSKAPTRFFYEPDTRRIVVYSLSVMQYYYDSGALAQNFPHELPAIVCLHLRYRYLQLTTHGLAYPYAAYGYIKSRGIECFANAFNRYFDAWYSVFPDLEARFGSRGNFFHASNDEFTQVDSPLFVNPPFDESLAMKAVDKIHELTHRHSLTLPTFWVLPNWKTFPALERLRAHAGCRRFQVIPKGKLEFRNTLLATSPGSEKCLSVRGGGGRSGW